MSTSTSCVNGVCTTGSNQGDGSISLSTSSIKGKPPVANAVKKGVPRVHSKT